MPSQQKKKDTVSKNMGGRYAPIERALRSKPHVINMDVSGSVNYTPNPIVMNLFHPEHSQESRTPKFFNPAALNQGTTKPPNQSCGPQTSNSNTATEAPSPRATNAPSGTNGQPEAAMEWSQCDGR